MMKTSETPSMTNEQQQAADYQRVAQAIHYLEARFQAQPRLEEVARAVHMSPFHFQRLFKRWAGISPKRFLQFLTVEYAKSLLEESRSVLETAYGSGLSGPGRLHDLFVAIEAVTPGQFKSRGSGLTIAYGFFESPFGGCLLAATSKGVCHLSFAGPDDSHWKTPSTAPGSVDGVAAPDRQTPGIPAPPRRFDDAETSPVEDPSIRHQGIAEGERNRATGRLEKTWSEANLVEDPAQVRPYLDRIFDPNAVNPRLPLSLLLKGTNFQLKVWKALLRIPSGHLCSYRQLARWVGRPRAVRAVANAVAANPVAYLIPCHRVIRQLGHFGGYAGGPVRKKALIGWEVARRKRGEEQGTGADDPGSAVDQV